MHITDLLSLDTLQNSQLVISDTIQTNGLILKMSGFICRSKTIS